MDVVDLRVIITVVSFLTFIGIVLWAYSGDQKKRFDDAANLPFADDDMQHRTVDQAGDAVAVNNSSAAIKSAAEVNHG